MHLSERSGSIPTSEAGRYRVLSRRTSFVRIALALALCGVLAVAVFASRRYDVRHAPLVASGSSGVIVLDLSASVYEGGFDATVRKLVETDERAGLVAFSDTAYELLPPGTPGREMQPLLRFFKLPPTGFPPPNPWDRFRAGTRISEGLLAARDALVREGAKGTIVLVSDLQILPDEVTRLIGVVADLRRDGFRIRIVPLAPSVESRALIEQLVGSNAFLSDPTGSRAVRTRQEENVFGGLPWAFLAVGFVLVALLAVNERLLARLDVVR